MLRNNLGSESEIASWLINVFVSTVSGARAWFELNVRIVIAPGTA